MAAQDILPPRVTSLRPPVPPIEDPESQWPQPFTAPSIRESRDRSTDLSTLPPHVRRFLNRQGVGVSGASHEEISDLITRYNWSDTPLGWYDWQSNQIKLHYDRSTQLFPESVPGGGISPKTSTARHEAGHAVDGAMVRIRPDLSSNSREFRSICIKYNSGVPGSGGGMGEFVDYYFRKCSELYAQLLGSYYTNAENLRQNDPQAYDFMRRVDSTVRFRGMSPKQHVLPPMTPVGG